MTSPGSASSRSRIVFIDLGRALAVIFMLYGHTASALLDPAYQTGPWFTIWQFQRGLTSTLFLLLGGFAFSIATSRHWGSHVRWSPALGRRIRRFSLFILLGYALHLPVNQLALLFDVSPERWRSFVAVDVLQLVGVSLIGVQLLVLVTRSRRVFTGVCVAIGLAMIFVTPWMWRIDWTARLPAAAAAYLSQETGSLFPLFPWASFVLIGAGFGQIYARWGAAHLATYTTRALLLPGAVMLAIALALRFGARTAFGSGLAGEAPSEMLLRTGTCLILLAALAFLSRRLTHLPHAFGAVAQESLLIYFVHLCIVYGSVWNQGLVRWYGAALPPAGVLFWVAVVITSMVALAWYWNRWKHVSPRGARWVALGAGAVLLMKLL